MTSLRSILETGKDLFPTFFDDTHNKVVETEYLKAAARALWSRDHSHAEKSVCGCFDHPEDVRERQIEREEFMTVGSSRFLLCDEPGVIQYRR